MHPPDSSSVWVPPALRGAAGEAGAVRSQRTPGPGSLCGHVRQTLHLHGQLDTNSSITVLMELHPSPELVWASVDRRLMTQPWGGGGQRCGHLLPDQRLLTFETTWGPMGLTVGTPHPEEGLGAPSSELQKACSFRKKLSGWQVGEVHNQQEWTLHLITAVDPETTRPDRDARKDLDGALAAGTGNHSWGPKDRETSL
ncbi:hypothetical protein MG293_007986 [Ovis ammon polii]|uniref:Uncharacterized protein n=1 Tax=Ovis ammon polii TaxID=230172 RepID=A0AAD4YCQ8_OVIAM|nr:hypothetical protein MG293_007986 [Ovis ammon polii]